jgi:hypothetical protein
MVFLIEPHSPKLEGIHETTLCILRGVLTLPLFSIFELESGNQGNKSIQRRL